MLEAGDMFVYSFKASKKKMRLGILVLIGLIAAILIVVLTGIGGKPHAGVQRGRDHSQDL